MRAMTALFLACLVPCLLADAMAQAGPVRGAPTSLPQGLPTPAERALPPLPPQALDRVPPQVADLRVPVNATVLARDLARQYPRQLEHDRQGGLRLRGEILALDPTPAALEAAVADGFRIGETRRIHSLDMALVVLLPKPRMNTRAALARLQTLDPTGVYTYNHVYLGATASTGQDATSGTATASPTGVRGLRIGLVDGGVDASHPSMAGTRVVTWGCNGKVRTSVHGTAVASLLAGTAGGPVADAVLYSADIYCGEPAGGSVLQLVQALDWLASQRVGVVNLSLVGPDNRLLARAVQQMSARGHVLVSAVGNDGPRSPPLYPAAYAEVIGVTAVDERDRLLPEAVRGPHARFAAQGAKLRAAAPGGEWQQVRGTSFASALVARLAAAATPEPVSLASDAAIARLRSVSRPGQVPGLAIVAALSPGDSGRNTERIGSIRE